MEPLKNYHSLDPQKGTKLATKIYTYSDQYAYHSWFACLLLDLQADSRTQVRNGGARRPAWCHLAICTLISLSMLWGMWADFVASTYFHGGILYLTRWIWHCNKCSCAAVQNEVRVHCQDLFVCSPRGKYSFLFFPLCQSYSLETFPLPFSSLYANPFLWRLLKFCMPCLVRQSLIFFLNGITNSAISFRALWTMDHFLIDSFCFCFAGGPPGFIGCLGPRWPYFLDWCNVSLPT